jgi:isochorismate synthase
VSTAQRAAPGLREETNATGLFDLYRPGNGFVVVQAGHGLAADGDSLDIEVAAGAAHVERAGALVQTAFAAAGPDAVAVGALPFEGTRRAILHMPERVRRREHAVPRPAPASPVRRLARIRVDPEPGAYPAMVAEALRRIGSGAIDKVVLARTLRVESDARLEPRVLARRLRAVDPECFVFTVSLPDSQGALIGASPELLLRRRGASVSSDPLAGTARRLHDPTRDAETARLLLDAVKERREHRLTVEAVTDSLAPYCSSLHVDAQPALIATATLWHLRTAIRGQLRDGAPDALTLAAVLHPSPAVCGTPTAAALDVIHELETFERGFYAGLVGWVDARGDGEWAVALRCAEVRGHSARLYAGAGIVAGSDPEAEDLETEAKFGTVLRALGVETPE